MTSDDAAGDDSTARPTGSLPFDITVAHQARMYDYLIGGKDHFAVDRAASEEMLRIYPDTRSTARANRAFLGRAVRYLAREAGIRQFLDIGTGIPTASNTHEVAQAIAPESRVVYVDHDPIVLAHARALLTSNGEGSTNYIEADLRDTSAILDQAARFLDFSQPVAVTLLAILHAIPDDGDPQAIVATLMDAVGPGSYLAICHAASDLIEPEALQGLYATFKDNVQQRFQWRTRDEVARFFKGTDLVEPGLVQVDDWRAEPAEGAPKSAMWAGVGRKS
jgi:hypothetical protein